jgi:hypothetical protein
VFAPAIAALIVNRRHEGSVRSSRTKLRLGAERSWSVAAAVGDVRPWSTGARANTVVIESSDEPDLSASAVAHSARGDEEEGCLDMGRVNRAGPGRRRSSPATDQRALVVLPAGATVPALLGLVAVGHGEAA